MAITRTPMIDDDGSGTTGTIINNAWKQELYNQIDGYITENLPWTPVDASGAGLVFSVSTAIYTRINHLVAVTLNMSYPASASGAAAVIGGLPFAANGASGLYTAYGIARVFHIGAGSKTVLVLNGTTGAQYTNAQMSGAVVTLAGIYLI